MTIEHTLGKREVHTGIVERPSDGAKGFLISYGMADVGQEGYLRDDDVVLWFTNPADLLAMGCWMVEEAHRIAREGKP